MRIFAASRDPRMSSRPHLVKAGIREHRLAKSRAKPYD